MWRRVAWCGVLWCGQVFFVAGEDSRDRWDQQLSAIGLGSSSTSSSSQPDGDGESRQQQRRIEIRQGRSMVVEQVSACGGACLFHFDELCSADVGAADFGALASSFHTIVIEELPGCLSTASHNEAQRFVTLIDEL